MTHKTPRFKRVIMAGTLGLLFGSAAQATNGYFSDGYGTIAKGMGGAAAATTFDAFGGANNPATMAWVGNRVDGGLDWFQPSRSAQRSGAAIPTLNGSSESGSNNFLIPEFGYNRMLNSTTSLGLTVYGNGGLNTTYTEGNYNCGAPTGNNMLCGSGDLGVDMMQLVLAPTLSMKVGTAQSFGVSVLLGYQRFKADGLQAFNNSPGFPPFTGAPGSVTNNGYDAATGAGLRFGYYGRLSNSFAVGIAYATKMKMGKFDKYKGLFAEAGGFDIPANLNIGVALTPTDSLTLALDYQRIYYGDVRSIANSSMPTAPLGAANGPGFGWTDISVLKMGAAYKVDAQWTIRAGYNHGDNPVGSQDVTFNILAPGVVQTHYTLGLSYQAGTDDTISLSYMQAPRNAVTGKSLFNGLFPAPANAGGSETIGMSQRALGIAWSRQL